MRICVISSSVFSVGGHQGLGGYGGLESVAWWCARGLAERGHEVHLVAPQGSTCPGVNVIETLPPGGFAEGQHYGGCVFNDANGRPVRYGGYWPKLLELQEGCKDFVCIDHSWQKHSALLKMEGRLKCPILGVCHAPVATMYSSLPPEGVVSFVCISDDQKAHFEALHSPRQARRVYNGIDLDFYKPLDVPRSDRFLFLARFSSIKGPDLAIEACKRAGVGLDLIGDTSITQEPALYQHCCNLADGEQIRIVGSVPRGETVWWYSQAKALLHPNQRFREPFGLAPVEAMACGCPVIAFDYGAMRETIEHGVTGYLVRTIEDLDMAMFHARVWNQQTDCLRVQSRQQAEKFSIQNMVSGYEDLCQRALNGEVW